MSAHPLSATSAVRLVFAANGAALGLWLPRIPDVKTALEVDLFTLSLCFFMLPLGTMLGFGLAQKVIGRLGLRQTCVVVGPLFVLSIFLPAFAPVVPLLALALFLVGLTIASIEVAMNTMAGEYEKQSGRRIMTSCHAFWSFGSMSGALIAGGFAQAGISFPVQQVVTGPALALAAWWVAKGLGPEGPRSTAPSTVFALPTAAIAGLCALPMGSLMLEGAMMEWSALLLREERLLSPFAAALIYAFYAVAMAIARMFGDTLASRFGATQVIAASAMMAGAGIAAFAISATTTTALMSGMLLGLGIANIYPLAMSLAAQAPGVSERNIAAVALTAFSAFLIGPPLIGTLGSFWGLSVAFLILTPFGLYPLLMLGVPRKLTSPEATS